MYNDNDNGFVYAGVGIQCTFFVYLLNHGVYNLVRTTGYWNNLHQIHSELKRLESQIIKVHREHENQRV